MFKPGDLHREKYFARIRRAKRWMRPLPRRATIHNYPILKWFSETARKRSYLWSFRREEIIIALYVGSILTFLPLYGVQIILGFALAMIFRCNLMVVVALQMISNPFTIVQLWGANLIVGDFFLSVFSIDANNLHMEGLKGLAAEEGLRLTEGMKFLFRKYVAISVGGLILGYFTGFILSMTYQFWLKRYRLTHPAKKKGPERNYTDKGQPIPFRREDSA